jgi:hypothetical protein
LGVQLHFRDLLELLPDQPPRNLFLLLFLFGLCFPLGFSNVSWTCSGSWYVYRVSFSNVPFVFLRPKMGKADCGISESQSFLQINVSKGGLFSAMMNVVSLF